MKSRKLLVAIAIASFFASAAPPLISPDANATVRKRCTQVDETLRFSLTEGQLQSHFLRDAAMSAHLSLRSGSTPRVIVAFPAGNAGAGIWFEDLEQPITWQLDGQLATVTESDGMKGIAASLRSTATELRIKDVGLGSIRFLRAYADEGRFPTDFVVERRLVDESAVFSRLSFDGVHRYVLTLEPGPGTQLALEGETLTLKGAKGITLNLTALTDEPTLTPIPLDCLLEKNTLDPELETARQALAFLTYEEKLLAGSWRFLTYFGRDTLLSLTLLMPVLTPHVIEAGLGSVLDRLNAAGAVAHEEELGDWAAYRRLQAGRTTTALGAPIYDYKMTDDDFLLAPVAAAYFLRSSEGRARAAAFLKRSTPSGTSYAAALAKNIRHVMSQAKAYSQHPVPQNLISLRPGERVGDWRDSNEGLGGGRYPFSTNATFVPAALTAASELLASGLLDQVFGSESSRLARQAAAMATVWRGAHKHFRIELPQSIARTRAATHATELGLALPVPVVWPRDAVFAFYGVALDAAGQPIPVAHSDIGLAMMFLNPDETFLQTALATLRNPFPWGLETDVGIVVANPAFAASNRLRSQFTTAHYHGTVVWSWQQATLLAGVRHQLQRSDLSPAVRASLVAAERELRDLIKRTKSHQHEELWSFRIEKGLIRFEPFGQSAGHRSESNTLQLWSTVYLGLPLE